MLTVCEAHLSALPLGFVFASSIHTGILQRLALAPLFFSHAHFSSGDVIPISQFYVSHMD